MFDADDMGKWLSGEKLPNIEFAYNSETWESLPKEFKDELKKLFERKILTPAIHATISHALRNYSIEFVRKIVEEEHLGKLVYAGGDDVLAFVNLRDLFSVMRKLRSSFSGNIRIENGEIKVDWNNKTGFVEKDDRLILTMGPNAIISGGVVIAHYKTPLKIALYKVREVEKIAKDEKGKDSFAIWLLKHSGEDRIAKSKWRYENFDVLEKLTELEEFFQKKEKEPWISKSFIYNLSNEFQRLKKEDGYFLGSFAIFQTELKRLIVRASHGNEKERENMIGSILESLIAIFSNIGSNINNFVNLLLITALVSVAEE